MQEKYRGALSLIAFSFLSTCFSILAFNATPLTTAQVTLYNNAVGEIQYEFGYWSFKVAPQSSAGAKQSNKHARQQNPHAQTADFQGTASMKGFQEAGSIDYEQCKDEVALCDDLQKAGSKLHTLLLAICVLSISSKVAFCMTAAFAQQERNKWIWRGIYLVQFITSGIAYAGWMQDGHGKIRDGFVELMDEPGTFQTGLGIASLYLIATLVFSAIALFASLLCPSPLDRRPIAQERIIHHHLNPVGPQQRGFFWEWNNYGRLEERDANAGNREILPVRTDFF